MSTTKAPAPDFAEAVGEFEDAVRLHERRRAGGEERKEMNAARSSLLAQYEAMRVENERLRGALENIAEHPGPHADDAAWLRVELARTALNQAPETGR